MTIRTLFLVFLFLCTVQAYSQELLDLSTQSISLEDFPFVLRDVHYQKDDDACIGYQQAPLKNLFETYYFEKGDGQEIATLLSTANSNEDHAASYSVRINEFFISVNSSVVEPKVCSFDINIDFITHDADGDHLQYSYCGSQKCERISGHPLHTDLIPETLHSALVGFKNAISANEGLQIDWNESLINEPSTVLSALDRPRTKNQSNGVFLTFKDYCEGIVDTTYAPYVKRNINTHMYKVKFEGAIPKEYYAAQIFGLTYLHTSIAHFVLYESSSDITTSLFIDNAKVSTEGVLFSLLFGMAGNALYNLTRDRPLVQLTEVKLNVNPLTGALDVLDKDKLTILDKEVLVYHSRYSKSEEFVVNFPGGEVLLPKNTHALIPLKEQKEANVIIINPGDEQQVIDGLARSPKTEYYLFKEKKNNTISVQTMTTNMLDELKSTEVPVILHSTNQ